MAIFSMSAGFCSRSSGKGAVAQAAYRAGENFRDESRGRDFDFSKKTEGHDIHQRVLLPEHAPEWMADSEKLWNFVQNFETNLIFKRYAGTQKDPVAREKSLAGRLKALNSVKDSATQIIALPRELNEKQNIEMLEKYLTKMFVSKGLVVDYAIHKDKGNWHAHVAIALREVLADGTFSLKKITSNKGADAYHDPFSRVNFTEMRRGLADTMNETFKSLGLATRVDHRSLEDQGIKRKATIHEGPYARILEKEGGKPRKCEENRDAKAYNLGLYLENPAYLISDMAREAVVFSEADIAKSIHKLVDGDEKTFQDLYEKVKAVSIPEAAKQVVEGGFQYKSDDLLQHFEAVFAAQNPSVEVIDFVRVGGEIAQDYLSREVEAEEFQRIGISNKLLKKYGLSPEEALGQLLTDPSRLINELAKEKIVFREKDVANTLYGLVGENETSYRLLEAYSEGRPLMAGLKVPANQTVDFKDGLVKGELDYWIDTLVKDVLSHKDCLALGTDVKHQEVFTSVEQNKAETQTLERVRLLASDTTKFALDDSFIKKTIETFEKAEHKKLIAKNPEGSFVYSDEQRGAIEHLLSPGQLKILKGRAGTGKSTVLRPVVSAFQAQGYDVKAMTFQGKIADSMEGDLALEARTIDSYLYSWSAYDKAAETLGRPGVLDLEVQKDAQKDLEKYQKDQFTAKSVIVIDEGSLVSHSHYELILSKIEKVGAKLLIVKDDAQNKAIHGADISAAMDNYTDSPALKTVQRQREPWMRKASEAFNDHRVEEGLLAYEDKGCIHYYDTFEETKEGFVESYLKRQSPDKISLGLTFLNTDVRDLNNGILKGLQEKGLVQKETFSLAGRTLAIGARVMFTSNDNTGWKVDTLEDNGSSKKGVKNGTLGTLEFFDPETQEIRVRLERDGRLVGFNTPEQIKQGKFYDALELGYVMTTLKSQGETVNPNDYLMTPHETANSTLVGMTRHTDDAQVHVWKDHASDFRGIAKMVGCGVYKAPSLDYSVSEEQRPYFNKVALYRDLNIEIGKTNEQLKAYKANYKETYPDEKWGSNASKEYQEVTNVFSLKLEDLKKDRKAVSEDILENWADCSKFESQASIREESLSLYAGKTQGLYTKLELKRLETVERYFDVAVEAKALQETMRGELPNSILKSHKDYGMYEALLEQRDHLASQVALAPESYQNLFKVTYLYGAEKEPIGYEMIGGKTYSHRPPTFERTLEYASSVESHELVFDKTKTGQRQSDLYEALKTYKEAHSQSRQIYHALKEDLSVFKTPSVKEMLESQQEISEKVRCETAYGALKMLDRLSYGDSDPILKHLGFGVREQTDFMDLAIQGQRMERLKSYHVETDMERRLEQSGQFHGEIFKEGVCDRKAYGQFKGLGEIPQRFTFEKAYSDHLKSGGEKLYASVDDLKAAFTSFEAYKEACQENRESWNIIKSDIKSRVDTLQLSQIEDLNKAGHFLSYEGLQKEAFEALKFNTGNENEPQWRVNEEKVLSYVSGELKRTVASFGRVKGFDARIDIRSRDTQLQVLQGVLDKGRQGMASYHDLMKEDGSEASWKYFKSKASKENLADEILRRNGSILEGVFGNGFANQIKNDARETRSKTLISTYQGSTGFEKASAATALLRELDEQSSQNKFSLRNQLRPHDLYGSGLELSLYSALDQHQTHLKEGDRIPTLQAVESYIKEARSLVEFKKQRNLLALAKVGDIASGYEQGLTALAGQFETFSPHKRLRFDGENLVKQVFEFAKEASIPALDQLKAYDGQTKDILKSKGTGVYLPIKGALTQHIEGLNETKHWKLSSDQVKTFTNSVLSVALEKRMLDFEIQGSKDKGSLEETLKSHTEAAGFALMATPLGDGIRGRQEKWAKTLVGTYDARCFAQEKLGQFVRSAGLEKATVASEVVAVMDSKSEPLNRTAVRKGFNENSLYRNSVELSAYSAFHKAAFDLAPDEKQATFALVQNFERAYSQRRDAYISLRNSAEEAVDHKVKDTYEKAQGEVFDAFERVMARGRLQQWDLRSLERNALNLVWSGEAAKVPERIEKDLRSLNERKSFGISEENLKRLQGHIGQLVSAKGAYEDNVRSNIKGDEESSKAYQELSKAEQKASIALIASPVGKAMATENGKWSMDLKKYTVASKVQDLVSDYQNAAGEKRQAIYEEMRRYVFGEEGKAFDREGYKICKENKVFFKREKGVGDRGQALGPQPSQPTMDKLAKGSEVGEKSSSSKGKNQPHEDSTIGSAGDTKDNNKSSHPIKQKLTGYEFEKFCKDVDASARYTDLVKDLMGTRKVSSQNSYEIRYGSNGAFKVDLANRSWKNFDGGEGGGPLSLVSHIKGVGFNEALSYISSYCRGNTASDIESFLKTKKVRSLSETEIKSHKEADSALRIQREFEVQKENSRKISDIKALIEKTQPITGTLAEAYLRNERGIKGELSDSLRYLPPNSSFKYGEKTRFVKTGAMVSVAKTLEGEERAVQLTYLTNDGKRCVDDNGRKFIKATYGSPVGAFVELHKGNDKGPIVLAEGVETALSVKETGLKGSYYCSLGSSNIDKLEVKNRQVIIAGDWDGSKETDSWKKIEKAKASLTEKGNTVFVVYPVEKDKLSQELTPEKVDFNDLLKGQGVSLVLARVTEQVPVEIARELSHRENQGEKTHEKTKDVSANKDATPIPQLANSTEHIQTQEKPLEKDVEVFDGEKLRKEELITRQHDIVITHRQRNGKSTDLFEKQFSIDPERALQAVALYDPSVKPALEKAQFESLMKPCVANGHINQEATLNRQYQLIIDYKNKVGKSTETIERQFKQNPVEAIKVQIAWDKNIQILLDPKSSSEEALRFLEPVPVQMELERSISLEIPEPISEKSKEIDLEKAEEKSQEKCRSQGLSL